MTGTLNQSWPGDLWKTGGGATWLGGTYDPETNLALLRHRQPGPVEQPPASRRQHVDRLHARHRPGHRRDQVGASRPRRTTAGTSTASTSSSPFDADEGRQAVKAGAKADRNGFFYVLDRDQRQVRQRLAVRLQDHLGQGNRRGRPSGLRTTTTARAIRRRHGARARTRHPVFAAPSFLGGKNWMPMAYSAEDRPVLRAAQRVGHGHLERADHLQEGRRLSSAPASPSSRCTTTTSASLRAIDPTTGKIKF